MTPSLPGGARRRRWQDETVTTDSARVIGMLGGMSWESSAQYYRLANEPVRERLGGLHSARVLLASVDFADIEALQAEGRRDEAGQVLAQAARRLEAGGAELLLICTNTMHKVADRYRPRSASPCCTWPTPPPGRSPGRGWARSGCSAPRSPWSRTSTATGWPATA
jgi:Asp/Glu/Hydantoin racemase